jgi:hypothetical protein
MDAAIIYRDDASAGEMHSGPARVLAYVNGYLCAMDREAKIVIPVSRWKLAEIGLACFWAALRGKGAPARSVEPAPIAKEALPGPPPEATESSEDRWERLMQEMRDLSR